MDGYKALTPSATASFLVYRRMQWTKQEQLYVVEVDLGNAPRQPTNKTPTNPEPTKTPPTNASNA